jgi:hypothetical protein
MSNQSTIESPAESARPLSMGRAIAIVIGLCVVGVVAVVLAEELSRYLGGEPGAWIGWGLAFVAVCIAWGTVSVRYASKPNSTFAILCAVIPAMGLAGKVEEVTRNLDWGAPALNVGNLVTADVTSLAVIDSVDTVPMKQKK